MQLDFYSLRSRLHAIGMASRPRQFDMRQSRLGLARIFHPHPVGTDDGWS
jgi:hypothetical protein